jgi:hypothetical protein
MTDDVDIQPHKAWAVLIYMAGDNDLEDFARLDIAEMSQLPSDENLHVVVQFDSRSAQTTRYRVYPGGRERVGDPLGETNTGDPAILTQFVTWGKTHFPADHTALIIWNHGTGLRDLPPDFDYAGLRGGDAPRVEAVMKRTLFTTTLPKLAARRKRLRGVAIDATDRDYLDTQELQTAIADVPGDGARVDVIGFDACLMSVIEIAYQLRGLAHWMIGSQEIEPGAGWPYADLLKQLAAQPAMSPRVFAETVVACYAAEQVATSIQQPARTQAALDLDQIGTTHALIQALTTALTTEVLQLSKVAAALRDLNDSVRRFRDRDLADLADWCDGLLLKTKGTAARPFLAQLRALRDHLQLGAGVIVANTASGPEAARIHGASIYWPQTDYSSVYDTLAFADAGWGKLIQRVRRQA